MTDEMKEKIAKLPVWARDYIKTLQIRSEPNVEEIIRSRKEVQKLAELNRILQDRISAMVAMFQCAAKGGNEVAAAVQRIVEEYIVVSQPEEYP